MSLTSRDRVRCQLSSPFLLKYFIDGFKNEFIVQRECCSATLIFPRPRYVPLCAAMYRSLPTGSLAGQTVFKNSSFFAVLPGVQQWASRSQSASGECVLIHNVFCCAVLYLELVPVPRTLCRNCAVHLQKKKGIISQLNTASPLRRQYGWDSSQRDKTDGYNPRRCGNSARAHSCTDMQPASARPMERPSGSLQRSPLPPLLSPRKPASQASFLGYGGGGGGGDTARHPCFFSSWLHHHPTRNLACACATTTHHRQRLLFFFSPARPSTSPLPYSSFSKSHLFFIPLCSSFSLSSPSSSFTSLSQSSRPLYFNLSLSCSGQGVTRLSSTHLPILERLVRRYATNISNLTTRLDDIHSRP